MGKLFQELDKLAILTAVVEKGKINEAAEILHLTQPSVSRAIKKLENAFGADIFIRSREGVRLTKAGTLLYEKAIRILRDLEDIQVRAKYVDHDLAGKLTVGTYESLAEYLWPDFLYHLQDQHPHLQLSVKTSLHHDPLEDLIAGKVDLLVDAEPQTKSSLVSWPLYSDTFGFYVATKANEVDYKTSDANQTTIIYVQGAFDGDRLTIEDHLEREGYSFSRRLCFDSFSTVKRMAIRGMGLAVLPIRLATEDEKNKLIKRVSLKGFAAQGFGRHSICATVKDENRKDARIKKIVTLLKEHFK